MISDFQLDGMLLQPAPSARPADGHRRVPGPGDVRALRASPEFRGALAKAGLPQPRIEALGDVAHAYVHPSAVTLVGTTVAR